MQETPNDKISFLDMELRHQANNGPNAQGVDYAAMGVRQYDEVTKPRLEAQHEAAREEGSKH